MRRFPFLVVVMLVLLWGPVAGAGADSIENTNADTPILQILVYGDSLSSAYGMSESRGWVALLDERLQEREAVWQVSNASISGETTAGGRERLPQVLQRTPPDLVILALGGNDGLRGLPPASLRDNLDAMLDQIDVSGAETLLLGIRIPPNYGRRYTERFEAVFTDLASARDLAFEPFFLESVVLEDGMLMEDGIHPTAQAQPQLLDAVWPHLEPLLERLEAREPSAP